uniref:Promastigote surface antigen n=1 Tax=Leishmania donovani TaxID=5661 RepID=Q4JI42_LEIDO|nr:promastigote surface antigen [Leishmania donovani]
MALCVRRLVLAATLAAVVALLLCTSSAPVARAAGKDDFTPEQRTNTLAVLQAFGRAIPELGKKWIGNDFCAWEYIKCYSSAVSLWMDSVDYAGTLPEMPAGVDYKHVVITQLDFSAKGQRLSGTLPASWSSMTSLMSLWLEGCERVTGTLPASWSSMKALSSLNLHGTQVSGSLPPQWSSMTSLATLSLRLTKVSGSLPPQWSSMASLTLLDLQGAKVSGSLPSEWREMKSAEVLQLQDCDLSGSLPSSWSAMPKLREVLLSGNHFCGCVPQSWTSTQRIAVTIEDEHKGRNCKLENKCRQAAPTTTATPTATPTLAPETECEVDGCEVCEGDSAARCARCGAGYFLTSEKTCRANGDGGVAAVSSGAAAAAAVCMAVLLSVGLAA